MYELFIIYCLASATPSASTCDSYNFMEWFETRVECERQLDKFLKEDRVEVEENIVPDNAYLYNLGCTNYLEYPIHPKITI